MTDNNAMRPISLKRSRWSKTHLTAGLVGLLLLSAIGTAGYFYIQLRQAREQAATQQTADNGSEEATLAEIQAAQERIGKIVLLPEGETPTLVRIKDVAELTDNKEFFKNAQNGDEVLVYAQAGKAFLYRPSEHRLINLASVAITAGETIPTPTATVAGSVTDSPLPDQLSEEGTAVLMNGTSTSGLTVQFAEKLSSTFENIVIADRIDAARDTYTASVVVPINIAKKPLAEAIAARMGLTLQELPAGETKPDSDLLIILGTDQIP